MIVALSRLRHHTQLARPEALPMALGDGKNPLAVFLSLLLSFPGLPSSLLDRELLLSINSGHLTYVLRYINLALCI